MAKKSKKRKIKQRFSENFLNNLLHLLSLADIRKSQNQLNKNIIQMANDINKVIKKGEGSIFINASLTRETDIHMMKNRHKLELAYNENSIKKSVRLTHEDIRILL